MAVAYERPMSQNIPVAGSGLHRPTSALARGVQITELSDGSCTNPEPIVLPDADILMEQYLSPTKLQLLTGCDRLEGVRNVEMKVDTSQTTLNNFGHLLPNLTVLKLSGSLVPRIRDLGSSLRNLEVLLLRRCGVQELEGISAMGTLRELYLAYNDIDDLSPLSLLDELEVLDLEGNNVDDIEQMECLTVCFKLQHLTLDGNPVCVSPCPGSMQENYDYRKAVKRILTTLSTLDDKPLASADSGASSPQNVFDADWAFLEELQNDAMLIESLESESETVSAAGRPTTAALQPATAYRPGSALKPSSGFRPVTGATCRPASISGGRPSSAWTETSKPRPASSGADGMEGVESSSELTCGTVICGNPSKALRARRHTNIGQRDSTQPHQSSADPSEQCGSSRLDLRGLRAAKKEEEEEEKHMEEGPLEEKDLSQLMKELLSWKSEHEKRLEKIRESKAPQVFKIDHSAEDTSSDHSFHGDSDDHADLNMDHSHPPQTHTGPSMELSDAKMTPNSQHLTGSQSSHSTLEGGEPRHSSPSPEHEQTQKRVTNRISSSKLRDYEESLDEDTRLLKEYRKLKALEKHSEKVHNGEHTSRDQNRLKELRVPSARARPSSPRRIVVPSSASAPSFGMNMPEPPVDPGRESPPKDRSRKVRIGPTGLPGSSHSVQPPIVQPQMRDLLSQTGAGGGLIPSSVHRPPVSSSSSSSQHRIRRSLPEVPPLPSRHPALFKS